MANQNNARQVLHAGVWKTIPQWAESVGMPARTLRDRLDRNVSMSDALALGPYGKPKGEAVSVDIGEQFHAWGGPVRHADQLVASL